MMPVRRGTWVCSMALVSQAGAGLFQRARMPSTAPLPTPTTKYLPWKPKVTAFLSPGLGGV